MKKIGLVTLAGVLVVVLVVAGGVFGSGEDPVAGGGKDEKVPSAALEGDDVRRAPGAPSAAPVPDMPTVAVEWSEQTATVEGLVAYSHNVFVGEVREAVGDEPWKSTIPGDSKPQTQWSVEVLRTYKSSGPKPLAEGDEAIVNQVGGEDETGKAYAVQGIWGRGEAGEEDEHEHDKDVVLTDRLLRAGDLYMFATHYDEANGWHAISAQPVGNKSLEGDEAVARRTIEMYSGAAKND